VTERGFYYAANRFEAAEHGGTHIDAPNHFEPNQPSVDQIKPADFFAPGVTIDIRAQTKTNRDHRLTRDEALAWEKRHGKVPAGAVVDGRNASSTR
jgi:kynurenine formamidase